MWADLPPLAFPQAWKPLRRAPREIQFTLRLQCCRGAEPSRGVAWIVTFMSARLHASATSQAQCGGATRITVVQPPPPPQRPSHHGTGEPLPPKKPGSHLCLLAIRVAPRAWPGCTVGGGRCRNTHRGKTCRNHVHVRNARFSHSDNRRTPAEAASPELRCRCCPDLPTTLPEGIRAPFIHSLIHSQKCTGGLCVLWVQLRSNLPAPSLCGPAFQWRVDSSNLTSVSGKTRCRAEVRPGSPGWGPSSTHRRRRPGGTGRGDGYFLCPFDGFLGTQACQTCFWVCPGQCLG